MGYCVKKKVQADEGDYNNCWFRLEEKCILEYARNKLLNKKKKKISKRRHINKFLLYQLDFEINQVVFHFCLDCSDF